MPNLSKNISKDLCLFCGAKCCTFYEQAFPKTKDQSWNNSMRDNWLRLKYLNDEKIICTEDKDYYRILYNIPCKYLVDGLCAVYDKKERPLMCDLYPSNHDTFCPYNKGRPQREDTKCR